MNLYQAIAIDYVNIYTICPNGSCKEHIHVYKNDNNIKDRNIIIKSLCKSDCGGECEVRIDQTSARVALTYYSNKSITLSKRKFNQQSRVHEPEKTPVSRIKIRRGSFKFNWG